MKKRKLKLEQFRLIKGRELDAKVLAKVYGGDGIADQHPGDQCNTPAYTYSAQIKADVEASKEN